MYGHNIIDLRTVCIMKTTVFLDIMELDERTFSPSGLSKNLNMKDTFVCTSRTQMSQVRNVNESNLLCWFVTFPFQKHSCVSHNSFSPHISDLISISYGCTVMLPVTELLA